VISGVFVVLLLAGCSSSLKRIDTSLDSKSQGSVQGGGVIGIKEGQAIIQQESTPEDELRLQQWNNWNLEAKVNDEYYWLKRCQEERADPRLGGDGKITEIPELARIQLPTEVREEFGINGDGELKLVKREDYLKRLESERKAYLSFSSTLGLVKKYRERCEQELGVQRVNHGLPARRYQGKTTFTPDGRIKEVLQENENSLDDAFRIAGHPSSEKGERKTEAH
jgi:bifunctional DNA-binding transcriptional regulator/antitoxin component of YhaV-PrlF toxin-antitoxin module